MEECKRSPNIDQNIMSILQNDSRMKTEKKIDENLEDSDEYMEREVIGSLDEFDKIFNLNMEMLRGGDKIQIATKEIEVSQDVKIDEVRTLSSNKVLGLSDKDAKMNTQILGQLNQQFSGQLTLMQNGDLEGYLWKKSPALLKGW